jgi:hypothetical protein
MSAQRQVSVQVDGKLQEKVFVPPATSDGDLSAAILRRPLVRAALAGRTATRVALSPDGLSANVLVK